MESVTSKIHQLWGLSFFWKCSKYYLHFKNADKNWENVFTSRGNCIWIAYFKLSLPRREYFWLTVKSSLRFCISLRETFSNLIAFRVTNKFGKKLCHSDFSTVWSHWPCCLSKGSLKRDFCDIYLTTFFEMRSSEIHKLWGSTFFWKCSKFYFYFINSEKNWEKASCFFDNYTWVGCVNLSLLRRENLRSAVNVLTNSPNILHITKRDFFQLHWLHFDQ